MQADLLSRSMSWNRRAQISPRRRPTRNPKAAAKRLLAERLAMRGLTETDLFEISGGAKIIGARLVDKIANYLMGLCFEKEKVNLFIELAYQERWLDDSAVQNWFAAIGDAK